MILTLLTLFTLAPQKLTYAAGYIPNIQFAPFYVAQTRGYYAEEGIDLHIDYTIGPDVLKMVALNRVQIGSVDADAFLNAVGRGMPLVHIATLYQSYPIALISAQDILNQEQLKGKRIGISGTYGASYLGLKVMLAEMGLGLEDVEVKSVGFTQVSALQAGQVDAVVGYINNEPLRLQQLGLAPHTRTPKAGNLLPGTGLMTSKQLMQDQPELLKGFLRATFRGMHDVISDPKVCYQLVVEHYLPELQGAQRFDAEYEVLLATLPFWQTAFVQKKGYGQCNLSSWQALVQQMSLEQGGEQWKNWPQWVNREFTWRPK